MMTVEEACRSLLDHARRPREEQVPLVEAAGRRLSRPVRRRLPEPPFTRSRVDGYAVLLRDLTNGGPRTLTVAGVVFAGDEPPPAPVSGSVLRVMTGAALPAEVGAVVPFEDVPEGEAVHPGQAVSLTRLPQPGENIIPAGKEGAAGSEVLSEGVLCGPAELALLAAAGQTDVWVYRRARVAIVATGSELVPPGRELRPGQVFASNLPMLAGLAAAWGAEAVPAGLYPDVPAAIGGALEREAALADLVLVTGGVAGGDRDFARQVAARLRLPLVVDGIDFHPGGRCAAGVAPGGGPEVIFLSGGPGACLTAAVLLVTPILAALGGSPWGRVEALLERGLDLAPAGVPSGRGRRRAVPVELSVVEGRLVAVPHEHHSGSPVVSPRTDGVVLVPPGGGGGGTGRRASPETPAGRLVQVWPLAPALPFCAVPGKK